MPHVMRWGVIDAPAKEVWDVVGHFSGLADWHPWIASCSVETIDGVEHRRLALGNGSSLLERNMGSDGHSSAYAILEGPLPVTGYAGTISVFDLGQRCLFAWSSQFEADGDEAAHDLAGVYEAAIEALRARFA